MNNEEESVKICQNVAKRVLANNSGTYGNVILVITIVSVIVSLMKNLGYCYVRKPVLRMNEAQKQKFYAEKIHHMCSHGGVLVKGKIRSQLRKHLKKQQYTNCQYGLTESILEVGQNLSQEEVNALLEVSHV